MLKSWHTYCDKYLTYRLSLERGGIMEQILQQVDQVITAVNDVVWSNWLIGLVLISGLYFTFAGRLLQVRHIKEMVTLLFKSESSDKGVSSFQSFALSISGRVGTGNIAGVATAIALGGPGAIFWLWVVAFVGASSAFIESALAQAYKVEQDGEYRGGPAYYIEHGLKSKFFAMAFAIMTAIAMGLFIAGVQSNSIASAIHNSFGVNVYVTGAVICAFLALIIFGGVKRITKVAELIVPFMAVGYILVALVIIAMNITALPGVIALIFKSAFGMEAMFGGMFGVAIQWGVKRAVYSSEAGLGTSPHAAAAAEVSHPAKQGLVQAFSVYIDSLFVCSATAFMILITGMYNVIGPNGGFLVNALGEDVAIGPAYTQAAVGSAIPGFGGIFVAISLLFFAFTTIMAYYYIAECNVAYIMRNGKHKWLLPVLRVVYIFGIFFGAISSAELAWKIGDLGVGLMAWFNIVAIFLLRKPAMKILRDYEEQKKMGLDPVFDPRKLGIEGADFWVERLEKQERESKSA